MKGDVMSMMVLVILIWGVLLQQSERLPRQTERLWTIEDLAEYLQSSVAAVYYMRHKREGPPALKVGRELRWDPEVVRRWAAGRMEDAVTDTPSRAALRRRGRSDRADPAA